MQIGISGTTRPNAGILDPILHFVNSDKGNRLDWGTKISLSVESGLVAQIGWKDQGQKPTLMMSTVLDGKQDVMSLRKRPKQGQKQMEKKHLPFMGQSTAELPIPDIFDFYKNHMGSVDGFDHLSAMIAGLRRIKRGAWQALEHWLLQVVLVNTYVIAQIWRRENDLPKLRSQVVWREAIVEGLLEAAKEAAKSTPVHGDKVWADNKKSSSYSGIWIQQFATKSSPCKKGQDLWRCAQLELDSALHSYELPNR